jgi:hypothetical protein
MDQGEGFVMCRLLFFLVLLALSSSAQGQGTKAQNYAWAQIRAGQPADFNELCGLLDPRKKDGWDNDCRRIPARFLEDVLMNPKRQANTPRRRVLLQGVRIDGTIDLGGADVNSEVLIYASRIEGSLIVADSHWTRLLNLDSSVITGAVLADGIRSDSGIYVGMSTFRDDVNLRGAKIGGQLAMGGASFAKTLFAEGLRVEQDLVLGEGARFDGDVSLRGARIGGQLAMRGASFAKAVFAEGLRVEQDLVLGKGARFDGDVSLRGARIGGQLVVVGASFTGSLTVADASVGSDFFIHGRTKFGGEVSLVGATIGGQLLITDVSFAGQLNAVLLKVAGSLLIKDGPSFAGAVYFDGGTIGGGVEITDTSFARTLTATELSVGSYLLLRDGAFDGDVSLSGAKVGGNVEIAGTSFARTLTATELNVGSDLLLNDGTTFDGDVSLNGAKVGGKIGMTSTSFAKALYANNLSVEQSLFMGADARFDGDVSLVAARLGILNLDGASVTNLDLTGAAVAQEMRIVALGWRCATQATTSGAPTGPSTINGNAAGMHWKLGAPASEKARCNLAACRTRIPADLGRQIAVAEGSIGSQSACRRTTTARRER